MRTSPLRTGAAQDAAINPSPECNWADLAARAAANDQTAFEQLYRLLSRGIRFFLCRQLGPADLDDRVHDTFLIVVQALRRGELREPEKLPGFVRTIVRRQIAGYISQAVQHRRDHADIDAGICVADESGNPEDRAIGLQREAIMSAVLQCLPLRERDILTRFYLREQSQEEICAELNLTETQFRLMKSRAKARFGEMGRRRLLKNRAASISVPGNKIWRGR